MYTMVKLIKNCKDDKKIYAYIHKTITKSTKIARKYGLAHSINFNVTEKNNYISI